MQTPIKQVDPMATYLELREEIDAAMKAVMDSGWYVLGGQVADFEREMASSLAVEHCLGVGSGTDALHLALRTAGIGPGDLVLAPSHTAVATVAAVELAGAEALLVDVEPRSFTLDVEKLAATVAAHGDAGRLKAVIAVHLYGHPADLAAVAAICDEAGLFLIEDCAQAQGAAIGDQAVGSFGDFAAFSFYPTKNLGAFGDGGALVVRDEQLARRAGELRQYGWRERFVSAEPGMNTSGAMPPIDVNVLMKTGRTRVRTASAIAARGGSGPCTPARTNTLSRMKLRDWWTMRMELLTTTPIRITKPSMVRTSIDWMGM